MAIRRRRDPGVTGPPAARRMIGASAQLSTTSSAPSLSGFRTRTAAVQTRAPASMFTNIQSGSRRVATPMRIVSMPTTQHRVEAIRISRSALAFFFAFGPMLGRGWVIRLQRLVRCLTTCASAAGRAEAAADQLQKYPAAAEALTPRQQQALVWPHYDKSVNPHLIRCRGYRGFT